MAPAQGKQGSLVNLNLVWITHRENFISNRHHYMLIDTQISDPAVFDRSVK